MIWVVECDGELMFNARVTDIGDRLREEHKREQLVRARAARAEAERATATIGRLQAVADAALTDRDLQTLAPTLVARTCEVLNAESAALALIESDGELSLVADDGSTRSSRPQRAARDARRGHRGTSAGGEPVLLHDPRPEGSRRPGAARARDLVAAGRAARAARRDHRRHRGRRLRAAATGRRRRRPAAPDRGPSRSPSATRAPRTRAPYRRDAAAQLAAAWCIARCSSWRSHGRRRSTRRSTTRSRRWPPDVAPAARHDVGGAPSGAPPLASR